MPAAVVLLHGFAGTGHAWDAVAERLGARTLSLAGARPPRARRAPARRGRSASRSARADVLAAAPGAFDLCGYSMGGRLALHVALAAPERIGRLVLVSTTAGIEDDGGRGRGAGPPTSGSRREIERMPLDGLRGALARAAAVRGRCRRRRRARGARGHPAQRARGPRRGAARHRRRGDGAAVGPARRAARASTRSSSRASATPKFARARRAAGGGDPAARGSTSSPGAGHALPRERPAELAERSRRPELSGEQGGAVDAEPGPSRNRRSRRPRRAARGPSRLEQRRASPGRTAVVSRSAAAQWTRGGDPERTVERRGDVRLRAGRADERRLREQRADAAGARELQADRVGRAGGERARLGRRLVDRDPHAGRARAARACSRSRGPAPRRAPGRQARARSDREHGARRRPTRRSRRGAARRRARAASRTAPTRAASSPIPTLSFTQR